MTALINQYWGPLVSILFIVLLYSALRNVRRVISEEVADFVTKTTPTWDDKIFEAFTKPSGKLLSLFFWVILGCSLLYGLYITHPGSLDWLEWMTGLLVLTHLIMMTHWIIDQIIIRLSKRILGERKFNYEILASFLKYALIFLKVFVVLNILGLPLTSLIDVKVPVVSATLSAVIFLPVLKNIPGAFVLMTTRTFQTGDYIEVDGVTGNVEKATLAVTVLRGSNGQRIVIPNSKLANSAVANHSVSHCVKIERRFYLATGTTAEKLRSAIEAIDQTIKEKTNTKLVRCYLESSGRDGHCIYLSFRIDGCDYSNVDSTQNAVCLDIFSRWEKAEIEISSVGPSL